MNCDRREAVLAQSVERKTLNLVVVGSSPTVGYLLFLCRCEVLFKYATKLYTAPRCLQVIIGVVVAHVDNR